MDLTLEYKPDAARAAARVDAWWNRELLDRPCLQVAAPRPNPLPYPVKSHATLRDRWMDVEFQVACADIAARNTWWAGELLPNFHPNLGPEILSAAYGAELEFGETTSWSEPTMADGIDLASVAFHPDNVYFQTMLEMTRLALEVGAGKFLVGITDLHPGGDLAASLREPQLLCMDLITEPEAVHALMDRLRPSFYTFYEAQEALLHAAGQFHTTSWLPLFTRGRYYIPSCDVAIMVSPKMFREFFLPEIVEEVEWLDRSIYHLDGLGALPHLDALLDIPKLDAIQFVWGEGKGRASDHLPVFQRIQAARKGMHIVVDPDELDTMMEALRPEGVMLQTWANSPEEANALVARVATWR